MSVENQSLRASSGLSARSRSSFSCGTIATFTAVSVSML